MGNKTNINILKQGVVKNWQSSYKEEKNNEKALYIYKDLELKKFITKYFEDKKLKIFNIKIFYNTNQVSIFISYLLDSKFNNFFKKSEKLRNQYFESAKISNFYSLKNLKTTRLSIKIEKVKKILNKKFRHKMYTTIFDSMRVKKKVFYYVSLLEKHLKKNLISMPFNKNNLLNDYGKSSSYFNANTHLKNSFLNCLYENMYIFFGKEVNINLVLCQQNESVNEFFERKKLKILKKKIYALKWYSKETYYKESLIILLLTLKSTNASKFLAEFIANKIGYVKNQQSFFNFLKQVLKIFNNNFFKNKKNVQIEISGRINGRARSKKRIINVGNKINKISVSAPTDFHETTAFSKDGTLGVKVWIMA
jgi:ribosomal protein S3